MSRLVKHIKTAAEEFDIADEFARNGMSGRLEIQSLSRFAKDYNVGNWITQGFAPKPDSQIGFIFLRNSDDTSATIYKVNYVTGELLATKTGLTGLGHVNDATYNQKTGTVDVCAAVGIGRINPNTLEIDSILNPDDQVYGGISYDLVNQCLYGRNGYTFFKLDPYTCEIQSSKACDEPQVLKDRIASGLCVRQGSIARNGKIATIYNAPDVIVVYDYEGHDYTVNTPYVYRIYELPLQYNNGQLLSELEGGDFSSESEIVFVENCNLAPSYKNLSKIIKVDISKNVLSGTLFSKYKATPTTTTDIYCDATTTCNTPDGSEDRPFRYMEEAVYCALAKHNTSINIRLMTAGDYGPCYINGLSTPLRVHGTDGAIVNGIHLERVTCVDFRDFIVQVSGRTATSVELNQSVAYFNGITFNPPETKTGYYITCTRSTFSCTGSCSALNLTRDNCCETNVIYAEKASKVNLYSFSSSGLGYLVTADTASEVFVRSNGTVPAELHNGANANPSLICIAQTQSISNGGGITMSNLQALGGNDLDYMHNKIMFTFKIYDVYVSSQHRLAGTGYYSTSGIVNTGGNFYMYIINVRVKSENTPTLTVSRAELYKMPSPLASSHSSATKLTESSQYWPQLQGVYITRD